MDNQKKNNLLVDNIFVKAFIGCVGNTPLIVTFLAIFGIVQIIGWLYQLIIYSNFSDANILWIGELGFFESLGTFLTSLGWIIGAVYYILISVSLLYGFIYFIVLIFYILMLPFKKKIDN